MLFILQVSILSEQFFVYLYLFIYFLLFYFSLETVMIDGVKGAVNGIKLR